MSRSLESRIEARLRRDARAARRDPPPEMLERIQTRLVATRPPPLRFWRRPRLAIAAGLCAAALTGLIAALASNRANAPRVAAGPRAASGAEALLAWARPAPRALRSTLEEPLLAEVGRLARETSGAARFVAGRLPASIALDFERRLSSP